MQEYQSFRIGSDGNVQGVGLFVNTEPKPGHLIVISCVEGSPAARAVIHVGDELIEINGKTVEFKNRLPRSKDYTRALYTFDIGQNDLQAGIVSKKEEQLKTYIPTIINEFCFTNRLEQCLLPVGNGFKTCTKPGPWSILAGKEYHIRYLKQFLLIYGSDKLPPSEGI